ncbi:MAG: tyrosine-type recombinase/integrase, partial [Eubacterium sp.]|nr:tyrosine-type recombinase/integrase [Eubacterium sp.]
NLMLDFAVEYEIVQTNVARTFDLSSDIIEANALMKRSHITFTDEELKILWDNVDRVKYVDWILIQCYMGWRPQELARLRLDEVNLDEWWIMGGMKTPAGKQRVVPIHTRIRHLVKKNYDDAKSLNSEHLLNDPTSRTGMKMTYDKYANRFRAVVIDRFGLNGNHRPHDPRTTFITMAKRAGVDEYAIKLMVGHKIQDITEGTYTKRDIEWLRRDLEKIP